MKNRDSILLVTLLVFALGVVASLALGGSTVEAAISPIADDEPAITSTPPQPSESHPATPAPVAIDTSGNLVETSSERSEQPGARPEIGTIYGRIAMAASLFGEVNRYSILVTEQRNPNVPAPASSRPFKRIRSFEISPNRTPRFVIRDLPFSRYPYQVQVHSVGYNGSTRTVNINEQTPIIGGAGIGDEITEELVLEISRGTPFNLLLRNPEHEPVVNTEIVLRPYHAGGEIYTGTSDAYGQVQFDKILAGEYQAQIEGNAIDDIEVKPARYIRRGGQIRGQGATVTVYQGQSLRVEVFHPGAVGFAEASLKLFEVETTRNRQFDGTTDYTGVYIFDFLRPGKYQLDIHSKGHQRTTRMIRIHPDQEPKPLQVTLYPYR